MSGIEVIGLVLAIIPLVISGVEYYDGAVSKVRWYIKYKGELDSLLRFLDDAQTSLMTIFDNLLSGIAPEWDIDDMVKNPLHEMWHNETIRKKIHSRLYIKAATFSNSLRDIYAAMDEMKERLDIQPDGTVDWVQKRSFKHEVKRVGFTLRKSRYDDLMTRIRDGILKLERFPFNRVNLEALEAAHRIRSKGRLLKVARDTSLSIHDALGETLSCCDAHFFNLGLTAHSVDFVPEDEDAVIADQLTFDIAVSTKRNSHMVLTSTIWWQAMRWDEMVVKETTDISHLTPSTARSLLPLPSLATPKASTLKKKGKGKLFNVLLSMPTTIAGKARKATHFGSSLLSNILPPKVAANSMAAIPCESAPFNMCQTLFNAPSPSTDGYCGRVSAPGESETSREFGISLALRNASDNEGCLGHSIQSVVSLRHALMNRNANIQPPRTIERVYLAAVISSTMLQLYKTPWLSDILRCDDILFVQHNNSPLYQHAFIVNKGLSSVPEYRPEGSVFAVPLNPTVFSLGILLIEIILWRPLFDENQQPDLLADHSEARKHLEEVDMVYLKNYGEAVRGCLRYRMLHGSRDEKYQGLHHNVYKDVVDLLEEDLEILKESDLGSDWN